MTTITIITLKNKTFATKQVETEAINGDWALIDQDNRPFIIHTPSGMSIDFKHYEPVDFAWEKARDSLHKLMPHPRGMPTTLPTNDDELHAAWDKAITSPDYLTIKQITGV